MSGGGGRRKSDQAVRNALIDADSSCLEESRHSLGEAIGCSFGQLHHHTVGQGGRGHVDIGRVRRTARFPQIFTSPQPHLTLFLALEVAVVTSSRPREGSGLTTGMENVYLTLQKKEATRNASDKYWTYQ